MNRTVGSNQKSRTVEKLVNREIATDDSQTERWNALLDSGIIY